MIEHMLKFKTVSHFIDLGFRCREIANYVKNYQIYSLKNYMSDFIGRFFKNGIIISQNEIRFCSTTISE